MATRKKVAQARGEPLDLGPISTGWLHAVGISTKQELAQCGAVGAYLILKGQGFNVTLNLVYALEAVLRGCPASHLPAELKQLLREQVADCLKPRCEWSLNDPLYRRYHDEEWGVPVHDDIRLFEFLILEGAQAGLSWLTILRKREAYRESFRGFDPARVARFGANDVVRLLNNPGIVRNRLKVASSISNAQAFLAVQEEFGSFDAYLWRFVDGSPRQNRFDTMRAVPAKTTQSDALSKDLQRRGFRFVGSTICYAFMQAVGMVNDHLLHCYRHRELLRQRAG